MPDTVPGSGGQDEKEERCGNFNRKRQAGSEGVRYHNWNTEGLDAVRDVIYFIETYRLRYSLFHREIKRYDKETFEEIKRR